MVVPCDHARYFNHQKCNWLLEDNVIFVKIEKVNKYNIPMVEVFEIYTYIFNGA